MRLASLNQLARSITISKFINAFRRNKTDNQKAEQSAQNVKLLTRVGKRRFNKTKRTVFKHGFVLANALLIFVVTGLVWSGNNHTTRATNLSFLSQSGDEQAQAPLDTLSSADIAANIAKVASLPETITVTNQADSYNAQLATAKVDQSIVTKPQLVAGGAKSRKDIQKYVTKAGDTVSSLATKFGITSDSIKWSNGLTGDNVTVGKELLIAPRNGIVYKVNSGDSVESIVTKYQSSKEQLIAFNDIELSGLPVGENILIPDGVQPVVTYTAYSGIDSGAVYNFSPQWGGNGYTYGYCTYYAATRVSVPRNWGNANTWAYYARLSGWTVSSKPIAGAIAQSPNMSYWGHVAYVEEVSPDGATMRYSDMNALAGWNRIGVSKWVPISTYPNYIYH